MNPDDPNVQKLLFSDTNASERRAEEKTIAATFDLSALHLHRRTIWLISLEYSGLNTEKTVGATPEELETYFPIVLLHQGWTWSRSRR